MPDVVNEQFVRKCWEDLTKTPNKSLEELMGKHNKLLADGFLTYTPDQRTVAEYLFKIYSYKAGVDRANENEKQWRAGVAIALLASATVFLFGYQTLTDKDTIAGVMAAVGASAYIILGVYVGFRHRIRNWRHRND